MNMNLEQNFKKLFKDISLEYNYSLTDKETDTLYDYYLGDDGILNYTINSQIQDLVNSKNKNYDEKENKKGNEI